MTEVGARNRLVMAGLVVLGLLTVVAGVLSGRSTINYVLARDAREAALSWAEDSALIEAGLDLNLSPTATLGISYSGQFASEVEDNAVKGRFTWLF